MIRTILGAMLLLLLTSGYAQDMSRRQADSLLKRAVHADAAGRFDIFMKLAEFQILKPGEFKKDLDSAAMFISMAEKASAGIKLPNAYGHILYTRALLLKEQGHRPEALALIQKAIAALSHGSDQNLLGNAYTEYSRYFDDYNNNYQVSRRIIILKEAISAFIKSNNKLELGRNYQLLADLYDQEEDFTLTLANLNQALQNFKAIKYTNLQGIYVLFADVYNDNGDYRKALNYDLLALNTCSAINDTTMQLCEIQNTTGHTYAYLHDFKEAETYYREALKTAMHYKDIKAEILLGGNIAITEMKLHHEQAGIDIFDKITQHGKLPMSNSTRMIVDMDYLALYASMKNFKMGQVYFNRVRYQGDLESLTENDRMSAYYSICRFLLNSQQYELCRTYNQKHFNIASKTHVASEIAIVYHLAYVLDSAQNRYKSAVNNLSHYMVISDSLINVKKARQIYELQIAYDTEKKENEIRTRDQNIKLLKEKGRLQQASLEQAVRIRNETIGGILFLLVCASLFYRQYRTKQRANLLVSKKNEIITEKNKLLERLVEEKEWLLKEVHHRVKNNLHTIVSLLESQSVFLEDDAHRALEDSRNRIYAMSLIHQQLYQSENIKTINMFTYISEFVGNLKQSLGSAKIYFNLNVPSVGLPISQAIPLALIINEAVTNSIKYAFPGGRNGEIKVEILMDGYNLQLIIADNGIGMDIALFDTELNSLGITLIKGLTGDINGRLKVKSSGKGTRISVAFETEDILIDT